MNHPEFVEKDYIGINGVGMDQLIHPHFEIWQKYFKKNYNIANTTILVIFLPCAAIKPYYNSPIHRVINNIIDKYEFIQKFVISNAGIIPYEFCDKYPFESYDWNPLFETIKIKEEYIKITSERIYELLKNKKINKKIRFISYLRNDSESIESLKIAFSKLTLGIEEVQISGSLHITADIDLLLILKENLDKLKKLLDKFSRI